MSTNPYEDPALMTAFQQWIQGTEYVEKDTDEPVGEELEDQDDPPATPDQTRIVGELTQLLASLDGVKPGTEEFQYAVDDAVTQLEILVEGDDASQVEALGEETVEQFERALEILRTYQNVQWGFGADEPESDTPDPMLDAMGTDADFLTTFQPQPLPRAERRGILRALKASAAAPLPKTARWEGILGFEGQYTGDGRLIEPNALRWDVLPIPLRFVGLDYGAHDGAQNVGEVTHIERRDGGVIWGSGTMNLGGQTAQEAFRVVDEKLMNGVSMDLDDVSFEVRSNRQETPVKQSLAEDGSKTLMTVTPTDEVTATTSARIRGVTIVSIPAFAGAKIYVVDGSAAAGSAEENVPGMAEADTFAVETIFGITVPMPIITRVLADPAVLSLFDDEGPEELDDTPSTFNWVEDVGGLPKYIKRISKHLRKKGMTEGHAIATAVNVVKKMCTTGDLNYPGKQDANPISRAKACKAVAEWEAKKIRARAKKAVQPTRLASRRQTMAARTRRRPTFAYNPLQWRDPRNGQWIDMPGQFLTRFLDKLDGMFADSGLVPSYPESSLSNKKYVEAMGRIRDAVGTPEKFDPRGERAFQREVARLISDLYTAQDQLREKNFKVVPQGFEDTDTVAQGTRVKQATEAAYDLFDEVIADAEKFNRINWDKVLGDQELLDTGIGQWDDDADTVVPRIVPESLLEETVGEDVSNLPLADNVPRITYPINDAVREVERVADTLLEHPRPSTQALGETLLNALDGWEDPYVSQDVANDLEQIIERNATQVIGFEELTPEEITVLRNAIDALRGRPDPEPPVADAALQTTLFQIPTMHLGEMRALYKLCESIIKTSRNTDDVRRAWEILHALNDEAKDRGISLTASAARKGQTMKRNPYGQFAFDPDQLRWPKGTRWGGRWMNMPWKIGALFLGNDLEVKGWDGWRDSALGERGEIMRELDEKHVSNKGGLRDKVEALDLEGVNAGGRKIIQAASDMQNNLNELRADLEVNDVDPEVLDLVDTALDDLDQLLEVSEYDLDNIIEANRLEQETGIGGWGDEPKPRDPDLPPWTDDLQQADDDLLDSDLSDSEIADMQEGRDMMRKIPGGDTPAIAGVSPEKPSVWKDDQFNATPVRVGDVSLGADNGWRTGVVQNRLHTDQVEPAFKYLSGAGQAAAVSPDGRAMVVQVDPGSSPYPAQLFIWDDSAAAWKAKGGVSSAESLQKQLDKVGIKMGLNGTVGPFRGSEPAFAGESLQASAGKVADMKAPSIELFKDPKLTGPTPLTIDEKTGRVYGHVATWDTCHIGNPEGPRTCTKPPRSKSRYAYFHVGSLLVAEGQEIAVGRLVQGTTHATTEADAMAALAHYENTGLTTAWVRAGEDQWGIWISGVLRPGLTSQQLLDFRSAPLSGDWRYIRGGLEMVAALAVGIPGFPIPRPAGLVASGKIRSLVASGMVPPRRIKKPGTEGALSEDDIRYLKTLANRERKNHADQLASRMAELKRQREIERIQRFAQEMRAGGTS